MMAVSLRTCVLMLVLVYFTGYCQCDCHHGPQLTVQSLDGDRLICGHEASAHQVQSPPEIKWQAAEQSQRYTLIMYDTSVLRGGSYLHWLVVNIPGSSLLHGMHDNHAMVAYAAPSPPPGGMIHTYKFVLYQEAHDVTPLYDGSGQRMHFDVDSFVTRFKLQQVAHFEYKYKQ